MAAMLLGVGASAEIYRYQDENGNWHFTDTAPGDAAKAVEPMPMGDSQAAASGKNLLEMLHSRYRPLSPVQNAALAAVTIESSIGTGSGFFVTQDGYILTNRHVIEGSPDSFKRTGAVMDEISSRFDEADQRIKAEEDRLQRFEQQLIEYRAGIEKMSRGPARKRELRRYAMEQERYESYRRDFEKQKADYQTKKSEYESQISAYRYKAATAALNRHFTVICKNGQKIPAYLVAKSRDHDLALLKIDKYRTPRILPVKQARLSQGDRVYAIGSPLGIRDSVSQGIVSGLRSGFIQTDAKIYPGNSGGPLVTENGRVAGINSFKQLTRNFEGLGFAIPIEVALDEFNRYLGP
jgi:S1-C subfamily serine protease